MLDWTWGYLDLVVVLMIGFGIVDWSCGSFG